MPRLEVVEGLEVVMQELQQLRLKTEVGEHWQVEVLAGQQPQQQQRQWWLKW
jgi:hypothetical protein